MNILRGVSLAIAGLALLAVVSASSAASATIHPFDGRWSGVVTTHSLGSAGHTRAAWILTLVVSESKHRTAAEWRSESKLTTCREQLRVVETGARHLKLTPAGAGHCGSMIASQWLYTLTRQPDQRHLGFRGQYTGESLIAVPPIVGTLTRR